MEQNEIRRHAHQLIDRIAPSQVFAVVGLLEMLLDPASRAIANAPLDDEPETDEERRAVAGSKSWLAQNPEGISHEAMLTELGLKGEGVEQTD